MTNPYDSTNDDEQSNSDGHQEPQVPPAGYGTYQPQPQQAGYGSGYGYGMPFPGPPPGPKPDNALAWTIITAVMCCQPVGGIGIYYSIKVDSLWAEGRYQEAEQAAKTAKILAWTSFGIAMAVMACYIILVVLAINNERFS